MAEKTLNNQKDDKEREQELEDKMKMANAEMGGQGQPNQINPQGTPGQVFAGGNTAMGNAL